jgi:hypothetical protein
VGSRLDHGKGKSEREDGRCERGMEEEVYEEISSYNFRG